MTANRHTIRYNCQLGSYKQYGNKRGKHFDGGAVIFSLSLFRVGFCLFVCLLACLFALFFVVVVLFGGFLCVLFFCFVLFCFVWGGGGSCCCYCCCLFVCMFVSLLLCRGSFVCLFIYLLVCSFVFCFFLFCLLKLLSNEQCLSRRRICVGNCTC